MKAVEKVEAQIADAVKRSAKIVAGGKRAAQAMSYADARVMVGLGSGKIPSSRSNQGC